MAKCPKCGSPISFVTAESIEIIERHVKSSGVAFVCPQCHSILSVMDEDSLTDAIVARIRDFWQTET